jgi:hypothetical protein
MSRITIIYLRVQENIFDFLKTRARRKAMMPDSQLDRAGFFFCQGVDAKGEGESV